MKSDEGLQRVINDVEQIEHALDELIRGMKDEEFAQHHLPGDETMAQLFPSSPPSPSQRAPELGS